MSFEGGRQPSPWETRGPAPSHFRRRLLILLALAALALLALSLAYPPTAWRDGEAAYAIRFGLVGFVLLLSLAASRQSLATIALQLAIWFGVLILLVGAYGYRSELQQFGHRALGELMPTRGTTIDERTVSFARAADQQFWIDAEINGQTIRFLLDTGASEVVLTRSDAARLGFDPLKLRFTQIFETANGTTRGAPVELADLRIGPLSFGRVPASVNEGDMRQSLLGMRLLARLSSIEISGDTLTIRH
jgi:aspartyl protease family protein